MTKRDVVTMAIDHKTPPYVPWQMGFTRDAAEGLEANFKVSDLAPILHNHFLPLQNTVNSYTDIGNGCFLDSFGVIWDRSIDRDIGTVKNCVFSEPSLKGYQFPSVSEAHYSHIYGRIETDGDLFRIFYLGFSLFERAWILRGMENLLMDFYINPRFSDELLNTITEFKLDQIELALQFDLDCIYIGDDWGQQHGLLMGPKIWKQFLYPHLKRMYRLIKDAGKKVYIHCCGDVDELFDDLIEIGLDVFNPFQPEVMDVFALIKRYHGKLAFHGGLSTQKTLPFGTVEDVRKETLLLLEAGKNGGYIFGPAHGVKGDVPTENMLSFIETVQSQPGFRATR